MQLHPKYLKALRLRKCSAGFNDRESKWASRRRGEQKKLGLLHLWFIGGKKNSNVILLPAHKCFGLIIVTQNLPIANKAVQMLVAYFLMAEFLSLACFNMCSSTSRRGNHKIKVRTQNPHFRRWILSSRWAEWETLCLTTLQQTGIWTREGFGSRPRKVSGERRKGCKINGKHWKTLVGTQIDRDIQTTQASVLFLCMAVQTLSLFWDTDLVIVSHWVTSFLCLVRTPCYMKVSRVSSFICWPSQFKGTIIENWRQKGSRN